jgi:hypothetical protein
MNLGENLLCNLICIVAIAQDAIGHLVNLGSVALDDLTKGRLIACLEPRNQVNFTGVALCRRRFCLTKRKRCQCLLSPQTWSRAYLLSSFFFHSQHGGGALS